MWPNPGVGSKCAQATEMETIETWAQQREGLASLQAMLQGMPLGPEVQLLWDGIGTHSFQGDSLALSCHHHPRSMVWPPKVPISWLC